MERLAHTIPPIYGADSQILILGSFPSVLSREAGFYYGNKNNRFWQVVSEVLSEPEVKTPQEKTEMLLRNKVALWDVIASCEITGSSDSSIKNVIPNDISLIFDAADIKTVIANGNTAYRLYKKYCGDMPPGKELLCLPSTSPANAGYSKARLVEAWGWALMR